MSLTSFIRDDPRLVSRELVARAYPEKPRRTATTVAARLLKRERTPGTERAEVREFYERTTKQVQQLATDLRAGLARPEGHPKPGGDTGLLALASDPRLRRDALARAVFPHEPENTALAWWADVRKGVRRLDLAERRLLHTELKALAEACVQACK